MARIDKIKEALRKLEPEDKIEMHNLMAREWDEGNADDQIYENDEDFFNTFYANDIFGAVQRAFYGDYRPNDDYVTLDGYANLKSLGKYDLKDYISDDEIAKFFAWTEDFELEDYLEVEEEEANEVSEEEYYDSLEVLPPYYFGTLNGKNVSGGFAVGEPTSHQETPLGVRATYSGFYKRDGKYFAVGQVYFINEGNMGEPSGYSDDSRKAMTLNPDAFAKGGGVRKVNGREYSTGRNWTNDHRHHNKSEDYEVPQADRKRQYATGGGVRKDFFTGREYSYGRNWTNDHRHHNKSEDYEVPQADRKRKYELGGGTQLDLGDLKRRLKFVQDDVARVFKYAPAELLDHPVKDWESIGTLLSNIEIASDLTDNESDAWKYAKGGGVRKVNGREYSTGRNWTNDHKHHNKSEDYEVPLADRKRKYGTGGTMDSSTFKKGGFTPKEPIAFENSNLYFNGYGVDINGNKVVRVSFPNSRAFSIQTNGTLRKTHNAFGTIGFNEAEINSYVKEFGSPAQKKKLKIYKK